MWKLPQGGFKMPKNTATIDSHYRNKFGEKEIPTSNNKFDCLSIDKDIVKRNDVNDNGLSNQKSDQVSRSHQKLPSKRPPKLF